ncbi:MAG: hypothetical protein CSA62_14715 [Planctomycetota bacterium]|nr:MAG: hypothetical protein CSA62_14715 [Planctomycetota bacterium]
MARARPQHGEVPTIAHDASLAEAARIVGQSFAPILLAIDQSGQPLGLLREERIRLGLAGELRPTNPIQNLLEPLSKEAERLRPAPRLTRALVMAGGRGKRLHPLTADCPKPLLPVRGKPMLFRILEQLASVGIEEVWISVLYLGHMIQEAVGKGEAFGLRVQYLHEEDPLGTAGALGLLPDSEDPLLVTNGDIWTEANLESLSAWHSRHGNAATVATHLFEVDVPFGLVHFEGQELRRLEEKPTLRLPVNAGLYLFEANIVDQVPSGVAFDMVSWLEHLARQERVGHFPLVEEWQDLGSLAAYRQLGDLRVDEKWDQGRS